MPKLTTTVHHKATEQVKVIQKAARFVPFTLFGQLGTDMDVIKMMLNSTKPEQKLFSEIADALDVRTNQATLNRPSTPSLRRRRSATAKLLIDRGFIKKVRNNVYMVNPNLLVPVQEYRESIFIHWENL